MKIIPGKLILFATALLTLVVMELATNSQNAPAPNSAANPAPAGAEKAIRARLDEVQSAAQALDADKVFSFVMENNAGAIAQNGRLSLTRSNALESTRRGFEALQAAGARIEYHFDQQQVSLLSPTIALVTGEGVTSVTAEDGMVSKTSFAQSVVLVLTNGDWKIFHAHRSFVAPVR